MTKRKRKGRILLMGGNEDPDEEDLRLLPRMVELGGGAEARVVLCSAPALEHEPKHRAYAPIFERIGVASLRQPAISTRGEAESPELLEMLEEATIVFLTGGDQLRFTGLVAGTTFGDRLHDRLFEDGLVVAGTSAGAAVMGAVMITGGRDDATVRRGCVDLAPGLGFWRDCVTDTHFNQRGRAHRLLSVLGQNPQFLGVGIDEDTALDLIPGERFTVIGSGAVMVFDGRVSYTSAADRGIDATMTMTDVALHVLAEGAGFDLASRRPIHPEGERIERP